MTTLPVARPSAGISTEALSRGRTLVVLGVTALVALFLYYLVGVDEGMTSLFGHTTVVHELVHDARHFLGFPCH